MDAIQSNEILYQSLAARKLKLDRHWTAKQANDLKLNVQIIYHIVIKNGQLTTESSFCHCHLRALT